MSDHPKALQHPPPWTKEDERLWRELQTRREPIVIDARQKVTELLRSLNGTVAEQTKIKRSQMELLIANATKVREALLPFDLNAHLFAEGDKP